jgi:septal ring factor EnvC (AmiA/AmiB activator)
MPTRKQLVKLAVLSGVLLAVVLLVAALTAGGRAREAEADANRLEKRLQVVEKRAGRLEHDLDAARSELETARSEVDELKLGLAAAGPGPITVRPRGAPAELGAIARPAEHGMPNAESAIAAMAAQRAAEEAAEAERRAAREVAVAERNARAQAYHAAKAAEAERGGSATSANTRTCGPIAGMTATELGQVRRFCDAWTEPGLIVGAYAGESMMVLKISADVAAEFRDDRFFAERFVRLWMNAWKTVSDRRVVTLVVEWGDVEIARGQTTGAGTDRVTLR